VLFAGNYVIPWDLRYFHLPIAELQAHCLRQWQLPLWDPFTYFGRPLWANIQTQLFYPPRAVTLLLSNLTGGEHLLYWLEIQIILHIFLAGVFTYLLLRRLNASEAAALVGATVYQLGGFFASQTQHIGVVNAAAWMPLAWLSVLALAGRGSRRWMVVLSLSLAMSVLAGLPSLATAVVGSTLLLALGLVLVRKAGPRLPLLAIACTVWGLLLAAIQLLPTIELNFHSIAQYRGEWRGSGGGMPLESLVSLVVPNYYGIFDLETYSGAWPLTFMYVYCGIGGLMLALAAAFAWKRRESVLFALMTVVFCLAMLGDSTPAGRIGYQLLPEAVRAAVQPEFTLPAFILGVAVLAGLGAEWFLKRPWLCFTAVAVIAVDLTLVGAGRPLNTASTLAEPGVTRTAFDGSEELLAKLRLLVHQTKPPARVDTIDDSLSWPMTAPLIRIPTGSGYDPMAPERSILARLAFCEGERWGATYQVSRLDSPVLDLANIRYLLSRTPVGDAVLQAAGFRYAADLPGRRVYENLEVLPRFFLVDRVREVADLDAAARVLHGESFDPRAEAVVEGDVSLERAESPPGGEVKLLSYRENEVRLETETPTPAFLVTSETHYPGWRAWVDGEERPIYYTNVAFRGLRVPAGRHTVVMRFEPSIMWWGAIVSLLALIAALASPYFFRTLTSRK
jgi:hypothetical protein